MPRITLPPNSEGSSRSWKPSPFIPSCILPGNETLALRMDRICDNTLKVVQYLQGHSKVNWINYAGLPMRTGRWRTSTWAAAPPASTTHRQLSPEELLKAGASEDMVRLSIGIEHIDDILEDLEQALAAT